MNKLHIPAVALAFGASLAYAQWVGPFEGGEAANAWRVPPVGVAAAAAPVLDRQAVAAQGRDAARHVDSRAGYQSESVSPLPAGELGGASFQPQDHLVRTAGCRNSLVGR